MDILNRYYRVVKHFHRLIYRMCFQDYIFILLSVFGWWVAHSFGINGFYLSRKLDIEAGFQGCLQRRWYINRPFPYWIDYVKISIPLTCIYWVKWKGSYLNRSFYCDASVLKHTLFSHSLFVIFSSIVTKY